MIGFDGGVMEVVVAAAAAAAAEVEEVEMAGTEVSWW